MSVRGYFVFADRHERMERAQSHFGLLKDGMASVGALLHDIIEWFFNHYGTHQFCWSVTVSGALATGTGAVATTVRPSALRS